MDEWQRRMRAEKEAERKKKTESAEILKGYKGGMIADADLKLKALREEDRKKVADAQQNLHSYKAKEIGEVPGATANKKQPRQSLPNVQADATAQAYKDPLEGMVFGSVQERAAALAAQAEAAAAAASLNGSFSAFDQSATTKYSAAQDLSEVETSHHVDDGTLEDPETITEVAPPETTKETAPVMETELSSENMEQPIEAVSSYTPTTTAAAVSVEEEKKVESDPVSEQVAPDHVIESINHTNLHDNNNNKIPVRLDILFSFGLVTGQPVPETSRYMDAVQKIVQQALDNSSRDVALDPSHAPFVKDQKVDGTFDSFFFKMYLLECV
jgi:hypothetical protein